MGLYKIGTICCLCVGSSSIPRSFSHLTTIYQVKEEEDEVKICGPIW